MDKHSKIYIAGHNGLVGSAILQELKKDNYTKIITRTRKELNLLDQKATFEFFQKEKPEYVFLAAAKVGGIHANDTFPAEFIYENLVIEANVIHAAHIATVKKLLFLGSSCIYPKIADQPLKEKYLLTGPLEKTNEAYAIAKIAGLMMCRKYKEQYKDDFISAMPTNLYGPNDSFHPKNSHVIPALIQRFHKAKENKTNEIKVWGTGKPKREFLFIYDLAEALVFIMKNYQETEHINVGVGKDATIKEIAELIKKVVGYEGKIIFDKTKPDGTPRKLLDVTKLAELGWKASTSLENGLRKTYGWYLKQLSV